MSAAPSSPSTGNNCPVLPSSWNVKACPLFKADDNSVKTTQPCCPLRCPAADCQCKKMKTVYNDYVAIPTNKAARGIACCFQQIRKENAVPFAATVTAATFLLSIPFGKFAMFRNVALAAGTSSFLLDPVKTVGTANWAIDRAASAAGYTKQKNTVVVANEVKKQ